MWGLAMGVAGCSDHDVWPGDTRAAHDPSVLHHLSRDGHVQVGLRAGDGISLRDKRTGLAVTVRLRNAQTVFRREMGERDVQFDGASARGGDWRVRLTDAGFEDFVSVATPAQTEVVYALTLSDDVAGLRLIGDSLELLDAGGAPRLRMRPPTMIGANGERVAATTLSDCAADRDVRPPWGRAVVSPGQRQCRLHVSWPPAELSFPAVLDPSWTTTKNDLTHPRRFHSASLLPDGRVLIAGGADSTLCEYYDPKTASWANGPSLGGIRRRHTATTLSNGSIVLVGGSTTVVGGDESQVRAVEVFDPAKPTWLTKVDLELVFKESRYGHSAVLLANDLVLITGGRTPGGNLLADAVSLDMLTPGLETKTYHGNFLSDPRIHHQTTRIGPTSFVVTGGLAQDDLAPYPSLFNDFPLQVGKKKAGGANPDTMMQPRLFHSAVSLIGGNLLVSGGFGAANSVEMYHVKKDTWAAFPALGGERSKHTMTALPKGRLLVVGGQSGLDARNDAELFEPTRGINGTWLAAGEFTGPRREHTATLLNSSEVLIVGGNEDLDLYGEALATSVVFSQQDNGAACVADGECRSLHCASGVCCDGACLGDCQRCDSQGAVGACTVSGAGHEEASCAPYLCDGEAVSCPSSCESHAECIPGHVCIDAECREPPPPKQDGASCGDALMCESGFCTDGRCCVVETCAPYRCSGENGTCLSACKSTRDCSENTICNSAGDCLSPPDTTVQPAASCRMGTPTRSLGNAWWFVLGLLGLAARRWRGARQSD
jgi:hypothetical protein